MENIISYQENGRIYHPDNCKPLVKAWKSGKVKLEAWARLNYPGRPLNEGTLPEINSIGYWDAQYPQEWGLNWHRNEGIEFTFLERGRLSFSLENNRQDLQPNDLTITRPWQRHKVGNPNINAGKLFWLILDVSVRHPHQNWKWPPWVMLTRKDIDELTKMLRQNEQPIWRADTEIRRCIQKICSIIEVDHGKTKESLILIYINEFLMLLLNLFRQSDLSYDARLTDRIRTVNLFIKYLEDNLAEPWTLELMAEYCKLGVTQYVHYFKQLTNSSPMAYLNFIRVKNAAKELIEYPEKKVSQICYEFGFSSSQYFATVFKKQLGCSPLQYKEYQLS